VFAAVRVKVEEEPDVDPVAATVTAESGTIPTTRKGNAVVARTFPEVPELITPPDNANAELPVVVEPVLPVTAYKFVPIK
jgi:hypothetical protein